MKKIVHPSYFVFDPSSNRIDFSTFPNFNFTYLYAVINVTAGKLIYSTAGEPAGLQGSYSAPFLNLNFDTTLMAGADELQIIYNMPAQPIADTDENGIMSTIDIDSGERGLNFNLLNSSFGGRINEPLSSPHEDKALAIGINSGGFLRSPAIDPVTNQLIVDISQSGTISTSIVNNPQVLSYPYNPSTASPVSFGAGATDVNTQRVTANINQINDLFFVGPSVSAVQNNIILGGASAIDCLGYRSFSAQLVVTASAGSFIFEASNDNVNFSSIPVINQAVVNGVTVVGAIPAVAGFVIYTGATNFRYLRIRIVSALTGGTVTAYVKLSPIAFIPIVQTISNFTASNLNANVSGSVTVSGSLTTVSTVSTVTSSNLSIPIAITDVASAALTTTTTTATITPTFGTSYVVNVPVTLVSGTSPTLDISIEESDDSGTNWFKVYDFPRITSNGIYRSPGLAFFGNRVRYVQTVTGGSPSFTRSINRLQSSYPAIPVRQMVDRTISLTTLNSVTPTLMTRVCGDSNQLIINVGAITTTAPAIQLEGSEDFALTWYPIGSPLTAAANSTVQITVVGIAASAVRARVSTAGVGVTPGYVKVKVHD